LLVDNSATSSPQGEDLATFIDNCLKRAGSACMSAKPLSPHTGSFTLCSSVVAPRNQVSRRQADGARCPDELKLDFMLTPDQVAITLAICHGIWKNHSRARQQHDMQFIAPP
jgi:hypothetical protein